MSECGADFAAMVRRQSDHYGRVIRVSVIECFETDGGVNYESDRLI
jgi:hypothetical protein